LVQNALKLTYEHLQVQKFFLGSLSLAMKGSKTEGGEGREGEGGEGRGGQGRGRGGEGKKGKGKGERGGKGREVPPNFLPVVAPLYNRNIGVTMISHMMAKVQKAKNRSCQNVSHATNVCHYINSTDNSVYNMCFP
jgi:hypothetical protein